MSTKKRVAEFQLNKEDNEESINVSFSSDDTINADQPKLAPAFGFGAYSKINPFTAVTASGFNSMNESTNPPGTSAEPTSVVVSGFGAYTNTNPFAAVSTSAPHFSSSSATLNGSIPSFGFGSSGVTSGPSKLTAFSAPLSISMANPEEQTATSNATTAPSSAFGVPLNPANDGPKRPSSFSSLPSDGSSFSSYTTKAPFAVVIPSPHTLSPKGQNPFSNPSPKHNPFVTIVESKDNLWSAASRSSSGTRPGSEESGILPGLSSFPFPSSTGLSIAANDRSSTSSATLDAPESKNVFGAPKIDKKDSKEGDEDDSDPVDGEHAEEQVYGKVYPMPDNVSVVTGEENEECVIQVRAKLFRLSVPSDSVKASDVVEEVRSNSSSGSAIPSDEGAKIEEKSDEVSATVLKNSSEDNNSKDGETSLPETKSKSIGEWVEVGIGPVRILKQKESAHFQKDSSPSDSRSAQSSKKRLVMRREDKKGGRGTKLLLNMLLEGYINVKKQGDRTFHITCICEISSEQSISSSSSSGSVSLSTYMFQTKLPQEADRLFEAISNFVAQDKKEMSAIKSDHN